MHISNLKLWNFRKFGKAGELDINFPDLNLDFNKGLNVIIGENDSGKSAIIDAIKLVLKTHSYDFIKVEDKDFYNDANHFRIELIFSNLEPEEAKNFTEWLGWSGSGENVKPYLKLNYDVKRQGKRIFASDVKAGVDDEGYQLFAEAREYLKSTYLKPLRDAENELVSKRNSRLSQILLGDSAFKGRETDHELVTIFGKLSTELSNYFKGEFAVPVITETGHHAVNEAGEFEFHYPDEGKRIKTDIDGYIKGFYGSDYETLFVAASNDIKSILEKLTLSLKDEPNPGLGTLNRLFMAAELLHLNKRNWDGIRLGLVEELEAHLHPQAQMQVIEALQKQKTIQLILTTHSPNLASKLKLDNLIFCNNGFAFPLGSAYTKLDPEEYIFLEKFLDTTKSNLFFAKGIILVEGWAEEILLPSIAKSIGINLTEKGVSIVNVGNTAFTQYSKIFLRRENPKMRIPVSVITDSDVREYEKDTLTKVEDSLLQENIAVRLNELSEKSEDNVVYFVAPRWTLEYSLLHSPNLSGPFKSIVKSIHTRTDWDTDFEKSLAEKLLNKVLKKTEIAYKLAAAIDADIVAVENEEKTDREISIINSQSDPIQYLIKAINYAAGI